MLITLTEIEWDTDGDQELAVQLPATLEFEVEDAQDAVVAAEEETGWLVHNCLVQEDEGEPYQMPEEWRVREEKGKPFDLIAE